MYHTNARYKEVVNKYPQNFKMEIDVTFDESTGRQKTITIPPQDIFDANFEDSGFSGSEFEIGAAASTCFSVSIYNRDNKYQKDTLAMSELKPKMILYDENGDLVDTVPLGVLYVNQIINLGLDIKLNCNDKMLFLDVPYVPSNSPETLYEIVNSIAISINSSISSATGIVPQLMRLKLANDDVLKGYSKRQILQLTAESTGRFVIFNNGGEIEFRTFTKSDVTLTGDQASQPLELNGNSFTLDGNIVKVTGVRIVQDEEEKVFKGTDEYVMTITNNPVATENYNFSSDRILETLSKIKYVPCKYIRIGGDPSLQAGDIITVIDNKDRYEASKADTYDKYPLYITTRRWDFCGNITETYYCDGSSANTLNKSRGMTVSKKMSRLAKNIKDMKVDITADMDNREKALFAFNQTMAGSMGLYTTEKVNADGSKITYMHDEKELESSQTIYKFGEAGFAWTDEGWKGDEYLKSGFDRRGNAILNSIQAYELNANVITTGVLQSQNGGSRIDLDTGTFKFSNTSNKQVLGLDDNGTLLVNGVLTNIDYPDFSVKVGTYLGHNQSFVVSDKRKGYGDILDVHGAPGVEGMCVNISAPFFAEQYGIPIPGIIISPKKMALAHLTGTIQLICSEVSAESGSIYVATRGNTINICNRHGINPGQIMINYDTPPFTINGGFYPPTYEYWFGNNTGGGKGDISCGNIICGGNTAWENTTLNVTGDAYINGECAAKSFPVISDRDLKENIVEVYNNNALSKVNNLKFYSYDFKEEAKADENILKADKFENAISSEQKAETTPVHIDIGLMADEAPVEIQARDGKAIDLYSYISLTAKAVQELTAKVEMLEAELQELKK